MRPFILLRHNNKNWREYAYTKSNTTHMFTIQHKFGITIIASNSNYYLLHTPKNDCFLFLQITHFVCHYVLDDFIPKNYKASNIFKPVAILRLPCIKNKSIQKMNGYYFLCIIVTGYYGFFNHSSVKTYY